jgi:hypothetical protein
MPLLSDELVEHIVELSRLCDLGASESLLVRRAFVPHFMFSRTDKRKRVEFARVSASFRWSQYESRLYEVPSVEEHSSLVEVVVALDQLDAR